MPDIAAEFEQCGFCLVPKVAGAAQVRQLKTAMAQSDLARSERAGQTYGARNLLHMPDVQAIAADPEIVRHLQLLLGPAFQPVRGLFFDKTAGANWPVLWHQDLSLAVRERHDLPGWSNWTIKRGVAHVQPPPDVLNRMVAVRLHLDDCPEGNGPLRLVPGSHRHGVLGRGEIEAETAKRVETVTALAGDALFMRPLILHASSPALAPSHRRVLHLEFAPQGLLPAPLEWANA